MKSTDSIYVIN